MKTLLPPPFRALTLALCGLLLAGHSVPASERPLAQTPSVAKALSAGIADAVEKVMPGVVVVRTRETRYRLAQDWFFGNVYRIPEHLAGQGSGIILTRDGYVLTNNHVVQSADEIQVVFPDGEMYPAELVGRNPHADIAVLKIRADAKKAFPFVEVADSDALRVGEFVIAIGSPFSLHSTVTLGIVSQKNRTFSQFPFVDFIQTDAAINQGNSGGPLVDLDGRMVGVNTFIQTAGPVSPGSIGIGFALPANMAVKLAKSIIETGRSDLPWIGILMEGSDQGVAVNRVMQPSPADVAGLRTGDIIVRIGERPIRRGSDLKSAIMASSVGEPMTVRILRGGREVDLSVTPAAAPLGLAD